MERQQGGSGTATDQVPDDNTRTDSLKLVDEIGRTFQDIVACDSQKYIKELLVLRPLDFEHGVWEDYGFYRRDSDCDRRQRNNIFGSDAELVDGTELTAVEEHPSKCFLEHEDESKDVSANTCRPRPSHIDKIDSAETGSPLDRGDTTCCSDSEIERGLGQSLGARMMSPGKVTDFVSRAKSGTPTPNERANGAEMPSPAFVDLDDRPKQGKKAVPVFKDKTPPGLSSSIPDYIMAKEAGGTGERNIRLMKSNRGVKGICEEMEGADGTSVAFEIGVTETRQRLIQKLTHDLALLEKNIEKEAKRWEEMDKKWFDYVDWKLKDLECLRSKRLAEEDRSGEVARRVGLGGQQRQENATSVHADDMNLEEREWNTFVEKELDGAAKHANDREKVEALFERVARNFNPAAPEAAEKTGLSSADDDQSHEKAKCGKHNKVRSNDHMASLYVLENVDDEETHNSVIELRIVGLPIMPDPRGVERGNPTETAGGGRTSRSQTKKKVTFAL